MDISYQALQVKQYDHDRYICCLFAKASNRDKLFTILAFNAEIALIAEQTSEITPALIRITWWQDAIDDLYQGQIRQHSLIKALAEIISAEKIPKILFTQLLQARMLELYQEPPRDMEELILFSQRSSANLLEIVGRSIGIENSERFRPLGVAWALLGMLRSVKYKAWQLFPVNLKLENEESKNMVKIVVDEIECQLAMVDQSLFTKNSAAIDLLFYLSKYYLNLLIKNKYDILSDNWVMNPALKQLYLLYRYMLMK